MKKLNIKALLVDHGEKFVFGLFAMIVLGILAGGTTWARYARTPDQLKRDVENAKLKITSNNPWPRDKEESFQVVDYSEKARLLFSMPPIARYDFSQWLFHPLYKKNEPKGEPKFEAVQYLIAKAAVVPLSVLSDEARQLRDEGAAEASENDPAGDPGNSNDEFELRPSGGGGRGGFPGDGGMTGRPAGPASHGAPGSGGPPKGAGGAKSAGPGGARPRPGAAGMMPGGMGSAGAMAPGGMAAGAMGAGMLGAGRGGGAGMMAPGMMGSGMMGPGMMSGSGVSSGVTSRGVRVMAVRGVFPVQKQIENYKSALHITQDEAADLLEITDFVLERQTAQAGPDPWKDSPWVVVNIESALEVLNECSDLDFEDPVPTALRDAVITMDLPLNLLGFWKDFATHPMIKNEELSLEAIEEEARLLEKVNETFEGSNLTDPTQSRRKGLAGRQRDFKSMVNQVNSNADSRGMMEQMMKGMKSSQSRMMGGDTDGPRMAGAMRPGGMMGAMGGGASPIDRLVARRKYLLFRYFDFDVEFGMAYRYRVRLELRNPNFERSADELGDIEIAKGEWRETPWSEISNPDVVRNKVGYFLKDVEREPYGDDKVKPSSRPVALLSMYEWDTTLGTVISNVLNLNAIGSYIGEEKKKGTVIPDLVAGTLEKGEHTFATQDALVDVESDVDVAPDQHPDLKLSADKGRSNARLGLLEEALVVTANGELKTLGQPANEYDRDSQRQWKQREDLEHKIIKAKETAPAVMGGSMGGDDETAPKPRKNPRQRGPAGGMSSMGMGMPGMPGGMSMPGGAAGGVQKRPIGGGRNRDK